MPKILAVIPARGGSKRVPGKNIRPFKGQPLLAWSIKAAQFAGQIDKIVLSTDDEEAARIGEEYGAEVFWRPEELATDTASTFDVLKHIYSTQCKAINYTPQYIVLLQPTSPLREKDLIPKGLSEICSDESADRLIELNTLKLFTGRVNNGYWFGDYHETTRSQELPDLFFPSGRIYIYKCEQTIAANDHEGKKTKVIMGDFDKNINIDYESDFRKLEFVFEYYQDDYMYLLR